MDICQLKTCRKLLTIRMLRHIRNTAEGVRAAGGDGTCRHHLDPRSYESLGIHCWSNSGFIRCQILHSIPIRTSLCWKNLVCFMWNCLYSNNGALSPSTCRKLQEESFWGPLTGGRHLCSASKREGKEREGKRMEGAKTKPKATGGHFIWASKQNEFL